MGYRFDPNLQGVAGMRHVKLDESASQAGKQASHQQGLRVGRAKECLEEWAWDAQALDLLLDPNVLPKYLLVSPRSAYWGAVLQMMCRFFPLHCFGMVGSTLTGPRQGCVRSIRL